MLTPRSHGGVRCWRGKRNPEMRRAASQTIVFETTAHPSSSGGCCGGLLVAAASILSADLARKNDNEYIITDSMVRVWKGIFQASAPMGSRERA